MLELPLACGSCTGKVEPWPRALDAGAGPEPALSSDRRSRVSTKSDLSKGRRSEVHQEPVLAQGPPQPSARATYLTIDFPQITAPFPQVWGLGEPLTIAGQLIEEAGPPVVQVNLRLASRGAGAVRQMPLLLATDADGRYQAQVSFAKKGDYSITAHYDGSPGLLPAEASRAILIVDYREEIVRLYNTFVSGVRERSSLIPEDATPREVEGIMVSRQLVHSAGSGPALDEIALDEFISAFEEADYSLHPIERRHYQRAYRAYHVLTIGFTVPSVLDMDREPGGEARNSIEPQVDGNKPASTNP